MRWLLLINLLAVVLLSGAVAIVLEGTPFGEPPSPRSVFDEDVAGSPLDEEPLVAAELQEPAITVPQDDRAPVPVPIAAPRSELSNDKPETVIPATLRQLRIATEGDFAPFNFQDGKGQPAGFDIDIASELCARMEVECIFETRDWGSLLSALTDGRTDVLVSSIQIPDQAPSGVLFSNPYYGSRGRFVGPADAGSEPGARVPLSGTQIAVQRATVHAAYLETAYPTVERVETQTLGEALAMVEAGKIESAFGDNATIMRWLKTRSCCVAAGDAVSDTALFGRGIGIAVRADDRALLREINRALEQMVADGTHARLSQPYFAGSIY